MAVNLRIQDELTKLIRQELIRNSMRQNALARQLGITPAAVSQLLNGKTMMKEETFNRICEILNVSAARTQEMRQLLIRLRSGFTSEPTPLGEMIAKRRTEYGISRSELAVRSGVDEGLLEVIETYTGNQKLRLDLLEVQSVARVLNIPLRDLLDAAGDNVDTDLYRQRDPVMMPMRGMLREPRAEYSAGYGPGSVGSSGGNLPPLIVRFQEFWQRITAAKRPLYYGEVAEAAGIPAGRTVELIMRGYDLELSDRSAWKLTVTNFENFYSSELALVRRRSESGHEEPFLVLLDTIRSRRVGRKLFRKANISMNINEMDFDIIMPAEKLETIPHGVV